MKPDPRKYSNENFDNLVAQTIEQIHSLSKNKGGEYSGDTDRLANFRRNASALDLTMEQVWAVYAAKQWDAVMQYVKDTASNKKRIRLEPISSRLDDLIVYAILMKAMIDERATDIPISPDVEYNRDIQASGYDREGYCDNPARGY